MNMDLRELRDNFAPISAIAFLGVIFTTLFVGFSLNWIFGISLELSLLLGAMISATDPVSVLATFKSISAPKKLSVILEGESVLNDGAAIVVFAIALEMIKAALSTF
jgi:CPA1 family monovalent cation:H+ antiporter